MNTQRLEILAKFLRSSVPEEHFSMYPWRSCGMANPTEASLSDERLRAHLPGMAACPIGWACSIPELMLQGLMWEDKPVYYADSYNILGVTYRDKPLTQWDAVGRFFDIDLPTLKDMFVAASYETGGKSVTALNVAVRIEECVSFKKKWEAV